MDNEQTNEQTNEHKDAKRPSALGCGSIFLMTIVFIVLKLFKVISWSWLWVFSPLWISVALFFVLILVALVSGFLKR